MNKFHNRDLFYKYATAEVTKNILETLQVKCSSPLLFNDPFDSQIEIQHDIISKEEYITKTTRIICEKLSPFLKGGDVEKAHSLVTNEMLGDDEFVSKQFDGFKKLYDETNTVVKSFDDRVFCVSEINDNLLMWAHYSKNHTGAVIEFKCIPQLETALCAAQQVKYSKEIPRLTLEDLMEEYFTKVPIAARKIINEILLTKSLDWAFEKEWRVILKSKNKDQDFDMRGIFEEELNSVYLGCRISKRDKEDILKIVKALRKGVKIFESEKHQNEFKIKFNRLI